jgi:8-oxo-dGTP pyrophosphatase MutT (NUDIX family)
MANKLMVYHRCAATIVERPDGKVLLLARNDGQGWCAPGGKAHAHEQPRDTARRELQEETGLDVLPEALRVIGTIETICKVGIEKAIVRPMVYWMQCTWDEVAMVRIAANEAFACHWFDVDEALQSDVLYPPTQQALLEFRWRQRWKSGGYGDDWGHKHEL